MSAIELTLPVGILGPLPIFDLAVGAHPKMASGFLWGNPHEEDRERRLGKGSAVVLKELHYYGLFFSPAIETSNSFAIYCPSQLRRAANDTHCPSATAQAGP